MTLFEWKYRVLVPVFMGVVIGVVPCSIAAVVVKY